MPMPAPRPHRALLWIAVFKLVKATLLLIVAAVALRLVAPERLESFVAYLRQFPLAQGFRPLEHVIDRIGDLSPHNLEFGAGLACAYAVLYLIEGTGLWLQKRWAEYLTTIMTASLIPFELYEVARGVSICKALALAINIAIVIYLIYVLRTDRARHA